jgi:hypothetical protein
MVCAMQFPVEDVTRPARRHDPAIAEMVRLVGLSEAEDHGVLVDHGDGHPVSVLEIATDHTDRAYRLLRDVFPQTGYWPLLLMEGHVRSWLPPQIMPSPNQRPPMSRDDLLAQGWRPEDIATGQEAVTLAARLDLDDAPHCGRFGGRPPGADDPAANPPEKVAEVVALPEYAATLNGEWISRRTGSGLLLIPLEAPWQALAHIGFASTIEAPADTGHIRFHRYLWEEFEGLATAIGPSRMLVELARPPHDPRTALTLANRLFHYCPDLATVLADTLYIDEDDEDLAVILAGMLIADLKVIRPWWD